MTASEKMLTDLLLISNRFLSDSPPSIFLVDSAPDSADAVTLFSELENTCKSAQLPGSAISFDDVVASGTGGQALSLEELFLKTVTNITKLSNDIRWLIFTRPLNTTSQGSKNLKESTYDYQNNSDFLNDPYQCSQERLVFTKEVKKILAALQQKIGAETLSTDLKVQKSLEFLPNRYQSALKPNIPLVIKKFSQAEFTESGLVRSNYYFRLLKNTLKNIETLTSVSSQDYFYLTEQVKIYYKRLGYEL